MKIAIIGTGSVGSALGRGLAKAGHEVVFGVRDTEKPEVGKLVEDTGARAASVAAAASDAEVVVLAMPWGAAEDVIRTAGGLSGKIVLDCINPLKPNLAGLDAGGSRSAAEQVAAWAPGARVVKIFNSTGANNMANPVYGDDRATMLYCGDDQGAKEVAARLAADLGFEPVDAGPLSAAYLLEHFAMLWIHLAYGVGMGRNFAFKLVRR
ncbi:MAG TPA: NADPH-dependent F420 reductase [Thermoanaerobaculia bacterium]|nr:NADPH-dependent F420 reductase [Thermoanaerobaculia bacterium]